MAIVDDLDDAVVELPELPDRPDQHDVVGLDVTVYHVALVPEDSERERGEGRETGRVER